MGKKKVLLGAVALSMVLAGTGYAYWTDSLNITTKATTGSMDVKFVDLGLYAQYTNELESGKGWSIIDGVNESGYVDGSFFADSCNYNQIADQAKIDQHKKESSLYNKVSYDAKLVDKQKLGKQVTAYGENTDASDKIVLEINEMYPGYAQTFRTDIVNTGDIAAKLSKIVVSTSAHDKVTDMGNLNDMIGVALYTHRECSEDTDAKGDGDVFGLAKQFDAADKFSVGGVEFVRLSAILANTSYNDVLQRNRIYVNNDCRMDAVIAVAMDPDASGKYTTGSTDLTNYQKDEAKDAKSMNKGIKISVDFFWDQFNEGMEDNAPANILKHQNGSENTTKTSAVKMVKELG